jgi:hypothetical protein
MKVIGFDPSITVRAAWSLERRRAALSVDDLVARSDFITFHVPLTEQTRHMINAERIANMRDGAVLLNFSRRRHHRRRRGRDGAGRREALRLRLRLSEQPAEGSPAGCDAAASRGLHPRGRGQLRRDGRRSGA